LYASDTYYWDENAQAFSSFTVTANTAWFPTTLPNSTSWVYQKDINWPPSDTSQVVTAEVQSIDKSTLGDGTAGGNISPTAAVTFNLDDVPPNGTIDWPGASATVSSSAVQLSGTATDDLSGVQTLKVEITTGTGVARSCWNGSAWSVPNCQAGFVNTTAANPWSYTIPAQGLATGNLYYLRLQLTDVAGNIFISQTSTFTYDTRAPDV